MTPFQIIGLSLLLCIICPLALMSLWCDCSSSGTAKNDTKINEQGQPLLKNSLEQEAKVELNEMQVRKQAGAQD